MGKCAVAAWKKQKIDILGEIS